VSSRQLTPDRENAAGRYSRELGGLLESGNQWCAQPVVKVEQCPSRSSTISRRSLSRLIKREARGAIVQDQQLKMAQCARQAGISPSTSKCQLGKQPCDALVKDGATIASGLVSARASQPALSDAGRSADGQIVVRIDPVAANQAS